MQLMGKNKSFYRISLYYITIDNMHNNQIESVEENRERK